MLYYAVIYEFDSLPGYEIEEVKFLNKIPDNLTYPMIQPELFSKVIENIDRII